MYFQKSLIYFVCGLGHTRIIMRNCTQIPKGKKDVDVLIIIRVFLREGALYATFAI